MSYALTTLNLLSTITFPGNQGFPLKHCEDLLVVLTDLLEETAFGDDNQEEPETVLPKQSLSRWRIVTHHELTRQAANQASSLFAALEEKSDPQRFGGDSVWGSRERAGDLVLTVLNLIRNLSIWPENHEPLSDEPRLIDVVMRLCTTSPTTPKLQASSPVLTLTDLTKVHDHALTIMANLAGSVKLPLLLPQTLPRIFKLFSSYLKSPNIAIPPVQTVNSDHRNQTPFPPPTADLALEAFSRFAQPDDHRSLIAKAIPQEEIFALFEALVHMLPMTNDDYTIMVLSSAVLEPWVAYAERIVLSLYNLAFLAPPALKKRMRKFPGFVSVLMRLIRFYMKGVRPDGVSFVQAPSFEKNGFGIICRRGVETLKVLDDGADLFAEGVDDSVPTFGIGYGEPEALSRGRVASSGADAGVKQNGIDAAGWGLLAGDWEDLVEKVLCKDGMEDVLFAQMESLLRLGGDGCL